MRPLSVIEKWAMFVCPHCGFQYAVVRDTMACKWCHGTFKVKPRVLPPRKEVTC